MRIIPLLFISRTLHLAQDNTFINTNYAYANRLQNITIGENMYNRNKRKTLMTYNRYKNRDIYKCYFCDGAAYTPCRKCKKPACIRCDNTGFEPCNICDGTGRGGPGILMVG